MADPAPPPNGRYVTRYEWQAHSEWAKDAVRDSDARLATHEARLNALERRWDRWAGPFVVILAIMGAVATAASILSAVSHLLGW